MSKADEMFEELGFEKSEEGNNINYKKIIRFYDGIELREISFMQNYKAIKCNCWLYGDEIKAINKKCEELRLRLDIEKRFV